jgi:GNAT superfamily N-acetyltransferase
VEFALVEGSLDLDHERFAYAGKFVLSTTGKAVARAVDGADAGDRDEADASETAIVGATAFSADHDDDRTAKIRYVTVREDCRGEGIGPRLLRFTADALVRNFETVTIAVNNPIAYEACYRAGFVSTGAETGIAELELRYAPAADRSPERYRAGFEAFADRDLPDEQRAVLAAHASGDPPSVVAVPE